MPTKKVIVIGSGFGGIAAALRMRAKVMRLIYMRSSIKLVGEQDNLIKMDLFMMLALQ